MHSDADEKKRLKSLSIFEKPYWDKGLLVAGMDEAGRGPLAGPCVAAAVIMPPHLLIPGIDDSKKLSEKKRQQLFDLIKENSLCWAVGIIDNRVIDEINILNAAKRAFEQAFCGLGERPSHVLCDRISAEKLDPDTSSVAGLNLDMAYEEITDGDALCYSIAAASIIAKETRDSIMREYSNVYPEYGFAKHKGYATQEHRQCIIKYGVCEIHRISFLGGPQKAMLYGEKKK